MRAGDDPETLRRRAASLRQLAVAIDRSALHGLGRLAGDATWRGPTAEAFHSDWSRAVEHLHEAAAELRRTARTLEQQAASPPPGPR